MSNWICRDCGKQIYTVCRGKRGPACPDCFEVEIKKDYPAHSKTEKFKQDMKNLREKNEEMRKIHKKIFWI